MSHVQLDALVARRGFASVDIITRKCSSVLFLSCRTVCPYCDLRTLIVLPFIITFTSRFPVSKIGFELPLAYSTYPVPEQITELWLPKFRERRQPLAV